MKKQYQNIDDIFRDNFSDERLSPSADHWESVYKKVRRNNFFSTDFTRFNYIYSILILATLALSATLFIKDLSHSEIITEQQQIIELTDTVNLKTIYIYDTIVKYINIKNEVIEVEVDTITIINEYLKSTQQSGKTNLGMKSAEFVRADTGNARETKNLRIIHHIYEKKDTFIKYIEKPDEPINNSTLFQRKRNKK